MQKNRYERNSPSLTEQESQLLREKRVLVVGCGGLGGYLIELLTRIGVGSICAVDGDVFEESNLNRQLLAEESLLGKSKAEAAKARGKVINSEVKIQAIQTYLDSDNADELVKDCDAVLDGLDNVKSRKILAEACDKAGVPYIHGAVRGWGLQAAISMPGDHLIETLYAQEGDEVDQGALSFTPAMCASLQAALCVQLLVGRPVESGTLHYFDLLHQTFASIPVVL